MCVSACIHWTTAKNKKRSSFGLYSCQKVEKPDGAPVK